MTFEIAVATMYKTCKDVFNMLDVMNIHCNCLVINQCDKEDYYEEYRDSQRIRIIFTKERGLSKSRNMAMNNAQGDVLGFADDDLLYFDNFDKTILNYYKKNPKADIVIFNIDDCYKKFVSKSHKCGFFELSGYKSMQCTIRLQSVRDNNVRFDELFGTGSKHFNSGEENIFLADAWKRNNNIFYCKQKILKREKCESSWFIGFNDKNFILTRGAVYYRISKHFFLLYVFRFAIKYHNQFKPYTLFQAIKLMFDGCKQYKNIFEALYGGK